VTETVQEPANGQHGPVILTLVSIRRTLLLAILSVVALAGFSPPADAQISITKCSTKGLRFTKSDGYTTSSVKVRKLNAHNGAKCGKARKIAKIVAKAILNDSGVPAKAKGYKVKVTAPCTGCSPIYKVKAKKGSRFVKFRVAGGA
jgi:hypothetical protein